MSGPLTVHVLGAPCRCEGRRPVLESVVRGPLLVPRAGGAVDYFPDGVLAADGGGTIRYAGAWEGLRRELQAGAPQVRTADGVMMPPLLDIHTHVPQHPLRGKFAEGVIGDEPGGRLLAGLRRNVFPAEARCNDADEAERVARAFLADTLAHGVVGGAAYVTPSAVATEVALSILPEAWGVGLVMMNQNCPPDLRTDEASFEADVRRLVAKFGRRLIVTDRFAVAVDSPLRRRGARLAGELGLRTQTHLNEQPGEKVLVERTLYPEAASYADVYRRDGLLDHACIAAHCIHMRGDEWAILRDSGSVVAHCPTSNLLLGSGLMPLDEVVSRGIPYALGTDVGASPTVSMLAEMKRFLDVQRGRSARATPAEALYRATLAPAEILGLRRTCGTLAAGEPMSFVEVEGPGAASTGASAEEVIRSLLPEDVDAPAPAVRRVTVGGRVVFERSRGRG
jgi:guanine deaminase